MNELARLLGAPVSSIHRELGRAVDAGITVRDATVRPHRYQANTESPAYGPLRELLDQTVGIPNRFAHALAPLHDQIAAASIHGSWATGRPQRDSDIDVVVVSDAEPRVIRRALRRVGKELGREVDVSVFTSDEFGQKAEQGHPFVDRLLHGPRIDLAGDLASVGER